MNKYEIFEDKEQLARIIAFELWPQKYHKEWYGEGARCYADNNFSDCIKIMEVVDKIYNAGYRKVGEDEIVESMKTYDRARQETAEEIISIIIDDDGADLNKIAQKYGIELEDLYERLHY